MTKKKKFTVDVKEGALTAMAKRAGFDSWKSYCNQSNLSPLAQKRCRFARTASKWNKK